MCIAKRVVVAILVGSVMTGAIGCAQTSTVSLSKQKYIDKCKGAWAGQMIGVCYGAKYEFQSNGKPITKELPPWTPERVTSAIGQDDCYVEMTFLKALEEHGLDITYEQAGKAFGDSKYGLWHANAYGRANVRHGVMPPLSGHPKYNKHADDIDFQIEADLFGILCPSLPQESNRLCDIFGHIMNYGDGVYGGMFVAGMYAAAYIEDSDVHKVLQAGLDCIPAESLYHQCISDVIRWHKEHPDDWLATWQKIEDKWQDDIDCSPGNPFNIDAKINGAYIAMGLVYGEGDFLKTVEISTRCGQDADCNPSNAVGVLGCMKGYDALGEKIVGGIPAIADKNFSYTDYSFKTLIPACQRMTEKIILRAGGQIDDDAYRIAIQSPKAPAKLEQWTNQEEILSVPVHRYEVEWWNPVWKLVACGGRGSQGYRAQYGGRQDCLQVLPVDREHPAVLTANLEVPATSSPRLAMQIGSHGTQLKVFVNDKLVQEDTIQVKKRQGWATSSVDVSSHAGKTIAIRLELHPLKGQVHGACLGNIEIK